MPWKYDRFALFIRERSGLDPVEETARPDEFIRDKCLVRLRPGILRSLQELHNFLKHPNFWGVGQRIWPRPVIPQKLKTSFDATIKATVVNGKTFNAGKHFKWDKHYGKKIFAHRVVRPRAGTVDFTGFRPLLTNLVATINKHKASIIP